MVRIEVFEPIKTTTRYEFRYVVKGTAFDKMEVRRRVKAVVRGYGSPLKSWRRFGFEAHNFEIRHLDLWDSIYPMCFLTRNGGPLFKTPYKSAEVYFHYPILEPAAKFFTKRAENFGLHVKIEGPRVDRVGGVQTNGRSISFGGGKDSRLLLALSREMGFNPAIYTSGPSGAPDLPEARVSTSLSGTLAERIFPTLMSLPRVLYHGSGLGEVARETPWQQYYDWASRKGLMEMSTLLKFVGVEMEFVPAVSVLPYNLIQKILHARYPELYRYQQSVLKEAASEKNLHISLMKMYRGIDFHDHCSDRLFDDLLHRFVKAQRQSPDDFGYHRHREVINREMRAMIYAMRDQNVFAGVRDRIPDDWKGEWIDYVHSYVYPDIDGAFLEIYNEYAPTLESSQQGVYRVPV